MDYQLKNKRAFVSGSTKGIGFAIAKTLADEGAEVVINGRSQDSVDEALAKLKNGENEAKISGIACDFSKTEGIENLLKKLGHIDILVNNVGVFKQQDFADIPDEDWLRFYEVNVMSGVRLSRALLPHMLEQDWGRIIFISSDVYIHYIAFFKDFIPGNSMTDYMIY